MKWFALVIGALVCYLLGNLNGAVCVSGIMHDDVRNYGSGNAGLTNFVRRFGSASALFVVLIDGGKTVLACLTMSLLWAPYGMSFEGAAIGGLCVMLGHAYPALLGFRGGKGILSGLFVALSLDWRIALIVLAVFAVVYLITGYVSLGSVLASVTFGACFAIFHHDNLTVMIAGIIMGLLAVFMHRSNIVRLVQGNERKTNLFGKGSKE